MISRAEFYAFLIMALIWAVWIGGRLDEIRKELKALQEKMDKK
jgi:hypothetical protein